MEIFIHRGGQDSGPYSPQEIRDRMNDGRLSEDDLGWHDGTTEWTPVGQLPGIPKKVTRELVVAPVALSRVERIAPELANTKPCPFCAEPIQKLAVKCKHCGELLDVRMRRDEEKKRAMAAAPAPALVVNQSMNISGPRRDFPHGMHFILSVLTVGAWIPIWILHYLFRSRSYYY